jgi:hypothetical protein
MKYVICRKGSKISIRRFDVNKDSGTVISHRSNYKDALLCAKVERMALKRWLQVIENTKGTVCLTNS